MSFPSQARESAVPQDRPTDAEAARTLVNGHLSAMIRVPWTPEPTAVRHLCDDDGSLFVIVSDEHPLARVAMIGSKLPAALTITDISPSPGANRNRGLLEVGGILSAVAPPRDIAVLHRFATAQGIATQSLIPGRHWALQLQLQRITLTRGSDTADIPVTEYAAAEPDPFAADEDILIRHLTRSHDDILEAITGAAPGLAVSATGVDRYGLTVRVGQVSYRIAFGQPVSTHQQLARLLRKAAENARAETPSYRP